MRGYGGTEQRGIGPGGSVPRWRCGHSRVRGAAGRTIDTGRLFATSRRILWVGEKRNRSWSYRELVDVTLDGKDFLLHPGGGDNVSFVLEDGDLNLFGMIVGRAMRDG